MTSTMIRMANAPIKPPIIGPRSKEYKHKMDRNFEVAQLTKQMSNYCAIQTVH